MVISRVKATRRPLFFFYCLESYLNLKKSERVKKYLKDIMKSKMQRYLFRYFVEDYKLFMQRSTYDKKKRVSEYTKL